MTSSQWISSLAWIWRFARSEIRASRTRFLMIALSFGLGTGIVTGLLLLSSSLDRSIGQESKTLLGADLAVSSSRPLDEQTLTVLRSGSQELAQEISFASMLRIPDRPASRLVQVSAVAGAAPFYGTTLSDPLTGFRRIQQGETDGALVDRVLMTQFHLEPGDVIQIGERTFPVEASLISLAGQSYTRSMIAPRVIIPYRTLESTALLKRGSRVTYRTLIRQEDPEKRVDLENQLQELLTTGTRHFEIETIEKRIESLGRSITNVTLFINMFSFAVLVLGILALWSTFASLAQERRTIVATLRCVGASSQQVALLYGGTIALILLIGIASGAGVALALLYFVPPLLASLLPVTLEPVFSWLAFGIGCMASLTTGIAVLVPPLLTIRRVPALLAFADEGSPEVQSVAPLQALAAPLLLAAAGLFVAACALFQTLPVAGAVTAGAAAVAVVLWGVAHALKHGLRIAIRRITPSALLRHGLASLFRPFNQTSMVVVTLGLGVCLLGIITLTQRNLLRQIEDSDRGLRPNLVLFDIQPDQRMDVEKLVESGGISVVQQTPIVTMRLDAINGVSTRALREDKTIPDWVLRREYRSTFREALTDGEELIAGRSVAHVETEDTTGKIPITAEKDIADKLKIGIGSVLLFDVQGVSLTTEVVGIRQVDWRRVQTNFFFVFPTGVLEEAPQFWALIARVPDIESLAALQNALGAQFPNVSAIDLSLILATADQVLAKMAYIIRFLGWATILCALLVLASTIAASRRARDAEDQLYATLGATRAQLRWKHLAEYGTLGCLGTTLGLLLSTGASWGLAAFLFKLPFSIPWGELALIGLAVVCTVSVLGMMLGRLPRRH